MNVFEILNHECATRQILSESWQELSESQKTYLIEFEKQMWPLMESLVVLFEKKLSPEEIENIFSQAEETYKEKLTKTGKAAKVGSDTLRKINQQLDKLGKKLQDTEPVQNFDQKIEKLKQDIKQKSDNDSKIIKQVEKYGAWAKENPGKTAFVIGVLTAAAAFAGGPAGGAAVGFLLRSANEMLKGESASGSIGKAAKTAAVGALAGAGIDAIGDALSGAAESVALENFPDTKRLEMNFSKIGDGEAIFKDVQAYGRPEDIDFVGSKFDSAIDSLKEGDYETYQAEWQAMQEKVAEMNSIEYMQDIVDDEERAMAWYEKTQTLDSTLDAVAAGIQGAAQEKSNNTESVNEDARDAAKNLGKKAKQTAQGVAKQTAQKITKRKLMKAWEKQGKPLDAASIYDILSNAGLSSDEVQNLGLEKPESTTSSDSDNTGEDADAQDSPSDYEDPSSTDDSNEPQKSAGNDKQTGKADKQKQTKNKKPSFVSNKALENLASEVVKSGVSKEILKQLEKGKT
jgi:uncharacterized protein YoxC